MKQAVVNVLFNRFHFLCLYCNFSGNKAITLLRIVFSCFKTLGTLKFNLLSLRPVIEHPPLDFCTSLVRFVLAGSGSYRSLVLLSGVRKEAHKLAKNITDH